MVFDDVWLNALDAAVRQRLLDRSAKISGDLFAAQRYPSPILGEGRMTEPAGQQIQVLGLNRAHERQPSAYGAGVARDQERRSPTGSCSGGRSSKLRLRFKRKAPTSKLHDVPNNLMLMPPACATARARPECLQRPARPRQGCPLASRRCWRRDALKNRSYNRCSSAG